METDNDEFKKVEKMVRRTISMSKNLKCKGRGRSTGVSDVCQEAFNCADIIDYKEINTRIMEFHCQTFTDSRNVPPRIIQIEGLPTGFYLIIGALSVSEQLSLSKVALEEYSQADHTNLSNLNNLSQKHNEFALSDETAVTKEFLTSVSTSNLRRDIWQQSIKDNDNLARFKSLRWASLGYHYDWTKRMYQENVKSIFPSNLAILCKYLANLVNEKMEAEAAIINFYPIGTYMSGHLDDAEHAMEEPIVSISLGCPAIFLIGGKNKSEKPTPILIRSGDVIIMSKDSRYAYHGVPGVVSHNFKNDIKRQQCINRDIIISDQYCCDICHLIQSKIQHLDCSEIDSDINIYEEMPSSKQFHGPVSTDVGVKDNFIDVLQYLRQGRININVRRVARANATWVDKCGSGASYTSTSIHS